MQLIECPALLEYLENDPRSVLCLDIETTGFLHLTTKSCRYPSLTVRMQ